MTTSLLAVMLSAKSKNRPIFSFSLLFLTAIALRHMLQGAYSGLPLAEKVVLWYQTFEYLYIGVFVISVAMHALLLWHTSKAIRMIYVLMAVNICFYAFMHWQRNIMGSHLHNWSWDLYSWSVAVINYCIVGILLVASMKGVQNRNGNSIF
ncbi:hypothetical protein SG34_009970 [Thalassomonas viridans]|uniref:Uncharacterized protein n=1 Tax=Thalassomonas viridans TaxID=137584 RepID=A0AAF0CAS0_9GAMM|nr:hypothetical protein [Thalassomonas viridans]WDE07183.1 hypothetical protein SG34_009970 [Thalassomonas viridans]